MRRTLPGAQGQVCAKPRARNSEEGLPPACSGGLPGRRALLHPAGRCQGAAPGRLGSLLSLSRSQGVLAVAAGTDPALRRCLLSLRNLGCGESERPWWAWPPRASTVRERSCRPGPPCLPPSRMDLGGVILWPVRVRSWPCSQPALQIPATMAERPSAPSGRASWGARHRTGCVSCRPGPEQGLTPLQAGHRTLSLGPPCRSHKTTGGPPGGGGGGRLSRSWSRGAERA